MTKTNPIEFSKNYQLMFNKFMRTQARKVPLRKVPLRQKRKVTSNERIDSESIDEDVVSVFTAREKFGNNVQVRTDSPRFIKHILYNGR